MRILNIILAILPGLIICYLIFRFDRHEKEKILPLVICFFLGVAITYPALLLETWADRKGIVESPNVWMTILLSFGVVALAEELVKYICLVAYPYQKSFFNEPLDGIIYAVMIGMGFATFENILYALDFGLDTMAVRAFTAVPAHGAFGVVAGYFVGRAKFDKKRRYQLLVFGLLSAIGLHGLYDFFILQQNYEWLVSFSTLTLAVSIFLAYRMLQEHRNNSPYKKEVVVGIETTPAADPTQIPDESIPLDQKVDDEIMDAILEDIADEEE